MLNEDSFIRVNNDVNGNPRYVCYFLPFVAQNEKGLDLTDKYKLAVKRANKKGGRKFHNKSYGGGIAFQSYNLREDVKMLNQFLKNEGC